MHVEKWHTKDELKKLIRKEKSGKIATRLRGVLLALDGRTNKEAAADLGVAPRSIQTWVQRYNAEGVKGLPDKPRSGQPKRLTPEQEQEVAAWLEAGPDLATDGVVAWCGRAITAKIVRTFRCKLTLAGAYGIMHRLGYEPLRPRPFHPQMDPAKQESFKKDTPLLSNNYGGRTRPPSSRSGSRTR